MDRDDGKPELGQCCSVCGCWKGFEAFSQRKRGGYYRRCKACEAERRRAYVQTHAAEVQSQKRLGYYADVEASRAKNRARYQINIERMRAQDRERFSRPEARQTRREKLKAYYAHNQQREQALGRERSRRWRKEHPDLKAAQGRRRRARLRLTPGAHTEAEWQALKARYGHRCLCCGRREPEVALTRDHVIPLGFPGASDGIANIQPLAASATLERAAASKTTGRRNKPLDTPPRTVLHSLYYLPQL